MRCSASALSVAAPAGAALGAAAPQGEGEKHHASRPAVAAQHAVNAGEGGAFTDSVPALVAGGVLIAGAVAAAVHRVCRRDRQRHRLIL